MEIALVINAPVSIATTISGMNYSAVRLYKFEIYCYLMKSSEKKFSFLRLD
jgi:hypothetical protein